MLVLELQNTKRTKPVRVSLPSEDSLYNSSIFNFILKSLDYIRAKECPHKNAQLKKQRRNQL